MADNKEIGRIGQRRYGGVIYEEFLHELRGKRGIEAYRENASTIEAAAKKHGKSSSDHGHWIWPGTTLSIPAA